MNRTSPRRHPHRTVFFLLAVGAILLVPACAGAAVTLSVEERAWLDAHPVIRVAPDPDFPPVEYFDDGGQYRGMAADYLRLLERALGIRFEIARLQDWSEVLEQARNRRIDVFGAAVKTPQRETYMRFTEPHISLPGVIVTATQGLAASNLTELRGKKVIVVSGYFWEDVLRANHPDIDLVTARDIAGALKAVSFGAVDAMVGDPATTTHFLAREAITNLRISGSTQYRVDLALAVRSDWPELVPIFQKGLDSIGDDDRQAISQKWIRLDEPAFFQSRYFWILVAAVLAVLVLGVGWNRLLKRQVAQRTERLRTELSRRREAEHALERHRDELEGIVAARTEELRRSEENFRRIFESMQDAYFLTGMDGIVQQVNPSAVNMLGYEKAEDLISLDVAHQVYEDPEDLARLRRSLLEDGHVSNFEARLRRTDGSVIVTEANVNLVPGDGGEPRAIEGIARDITARTRAEAALRESEERLNLALHSTGFGIWDWDAVHDRAHWDANVHRLFGLQPGSFEGRYQDYLMRIHPEDRDRVGRQMAESIEHDDEYDTEYRVVWPDGTVRFLAARGRVYRDSRGEVTRHIGVNWDVTARKEAEYTIGRERALLRSLIDSIPDLIFYKDGESVYLGCNAAFARFMDRSQEELIGKTDGDLLPKDLAERFAAMDRRVLDKGQPLRHEEWATFPDGSRKLLDTLKTPYFGPDGTRLGLIGISRDITERQIVEEQLRRAKDAAEAAKEARSQFLANMSHEIRTPMNGIIGFTNLALRTQLSDKQRDYVNKIQVSAKALLGLINDILDFSKIEAGRLDIEHIGFRLTDVVHEVSDLFAPQAYQKGLEFVVALERDVPDLFVGDPLRLRQILVNLVSNAMKFTEKGSIVVGVRCMKNLAERASLRFSVRDSGIGIPREKQSELFQSFTQADGSMTRKYGGTGLGLAICKQLTELMGGRIGVDSEKGKGATFWLELDIARQAEAEQPKRLPMAGFRGVRALVADDNEFSRQVMAEMLQCFGFEVRTACSAEEGLAAAKASLKGGEPIGLALLDWMMPGMDGIELAERIRAIPEYENVPIVMVSAFGREREMRRGEACGIDAFLTKPVQQSMLLDTVTEVFERRSGDRDPAARSLVTERTLLGTELSGVKVLLAEDNKINQEVAAQVLREAGLVVDIVDNGLEALQALAGEEDYALVLMDMQMPEMDGYEATRRIRETKRLDGLPVIAMTAHAMEGDKEKCLAAGMNDYVSKPVEPDVLIDTLKKWVKRGKQRAPGDAAAADHRPHSGGGMGGGPLPESLPGLDIRAGVARLRGNTSLYQKLLRELAAEHAGDVELIAAAISSGDLDRARMLVHTLKGLSGNLSAVQLHEASARLEACLRGKSGDSSNRNTALEALRRDHALLMGSLSRLGLDGPAPAGPEEGASSLPSGEPLLPEVLEQLGEAVEMGDLDTVISLAARLPEGHPQRGALTSLAEDFDLDGLGELIQALQSAAEGNTDD